MLLNSVEYLDMIDREAQNVKKHNVYTYYAILFFISSVCYL